MKNTEWRSEKVVMHAKCKVYKQLRMINKRLICFRWEKKQKSASNADREITENASNSVNLVSGIIHLPSGLDPRSASETDDILYKLLRW